MIADGGGRRTELDNGSSFVPLPEAAM